MKTPGYRLATYAEDGGAQRQSDRQQDTPPARFSELCGALAEGWEIVPPIFVRPLWSARSGVDRAFHFVLHRGRSTRLVVVPRFSQVERFVQDHHLAIDDQ
jgi:hypothetical protein